MSSSLQRAPALLLLLALAGCAREEPQPEPATPAPVAGSWSDPPKAAWAGSESCRACHAQVWEAWSGSNHALADRELIAALDAVAFEPARTIQHGTRSSEARTTDGRMQLVTQGPSSEHTPYEIERVFGVAPLRQFVVPFERGRYQVTELAWDPAAEEWFDVYGDEDRRPGEWGHWTGRGMSWNSMCAACHTTRLRKGYEPTEDSYATDYVELGVGCESCHGPQAEHVAWQEERGGAAPNDPTVERLDPTAVMQDCGSCHSRRSELTGTPVPGDPFLDHHLPVVVDASDLYHADGQVRDEDFEYSSFLSSRMHGEGVTCLDCHSPHTGDLLREGNNLCLHCHTGKIEPRSHSQHTPGTPGGNCVDCHMPLTTYMQRHARRDHGFTIPDPLLTQEHGVPNACGRCHEEQGLEWQVEAAERMFGERLERNTRERARRIARARAGDLTVVPELVDQLAEERPTWRTSAAALLADYVDVAGVGDALVRATSDEDALVRSRALSALAPLVDQGWPPAATAARDALDDPLRAVRVEAAWGLRRTLPADARAARDLVGFLEHNRDQPMGAHRYAMWHLARGEPALALPLLERAVEWDSYTGLFRHDLAAALSALGRATEALELLELACIEIPDDPLLEFGRGLTLGELGELPRATQAFARAVQLDPDYARAWYNLGLVRSQLDDWRGALEALRRAESADPNSADASWAAATILWAEERTDEAYDAAQRVLARDPNHREARELLLRRGG